MGNPSQIDTVVQWTIKTKNSEVSSGDEVRDRAGGRKRASCGRVVVDALYSLHMFVPVARITVLGPIFDRFGRGREVTGSLKDLVLCKDSIEIYAGRAQRTMVEYI